MCPRRHALEPQFLLHRSILLQSTEARRHTKPQESRLQVHSARRCSTSAFLRKNWQLRVFCPRMPLVGLSNTQSMIPDLSAILELCSLRPLGLVYHSMLHQQHCLSVRPLRLRDHQNTRRRLQNHRDIRRELRVTTQTLTSHAELVLIDLGPQVLRKKLA